MIIVTTIAIVSLLISFFLIRDFFRNRSKLEALKADGVATEGTLLEVRNLGLENNNESKLNEIAVKFTTLTGKNQIIRHRKPLADGEIIPVGSTIGLRYLEADPSICEIPDLGKKASNKWSSLVTGLLVLIVGLFIAYVVFINLGTV